MCIEAIWIYAKNLIFHRSKKQDKGKFSSLEVVADASGQLMFLVEKDCLLDFHLFEFFYGFDYKGVDLSIFVIIDQIGDYFIFLSEYMCEMVILLFDRD